MTGPIITTTRIGPRMYRAEIGEQSALVAGRSDDEATNHLQAARWLRDDLGLAGALHGRQEAARPDPDCPTCVGTGATRTYSPCGDPECCSEADPESPCSCLQERHSWSVGWVRET